MALKKNLPSYKKRLSLGFLTVSLISCSALGQWWYDRLDIYLANYFFKYADFSDEQKSYIRSVTKDYLEWNSTSEIPKYKLKNDIKKDLLKLFNSDLQSIKGDEYQPIKNLKKLENRNIKLGRTRPPDRPRG